MKYTLVSRVLLPLLFVGLAACAAFAGPANAPDPCPVRCSTGTCCSPWQSCAADGRCRTEDPWPYGVARDAGADR